MAPGATFDTRCPDMKQRWNSAWQKTMHKSAPKLKLKYAKRGSKYLLALSAVCRCESTSELAQAPNERHNAITDWMRVFRSRNAPIMSK